VQLGRKLLGVCVTSLKYYLVVVDTDVGVRPNPDQARTMDARTMDEKIIAICSRSEDADVCV
jgi:hypothetical protein